jgi:hypothetical protein
MQVVHVQTDNIHTEVDVVLVELVLEMLAGVRRVASIKSLGLTSVMFDETLTTGKQLVATLRRAGFEAREYRPALS